MPKEFRNDYGSFEQRLAVFCRPTHWEIQNGIKIVDQEIIDMGEDMKLVVVAKSDNTKTMIVFYNGSKNSNPCWFGWMPSKNQMNMMPRIKETYDSIDILNAQNKWGNNNGV